MVMVAVRVTLTRRRRRRHPLPGALEDSLGEGKDEPRSGGAQKKGPAGRSHAEPFRGQVMHSSGLLRSVPRMCAYYINAEMGRKGFGAIWQVRPRNAQDS